MKSPQSKKRKPDPLQMDTMLIAHQDGDLRYRLKRGGYCLVADTISISVETQATKADQFPDCADIALERHPCQAPLRRGAVFQCKGGMSDNQQDDSAKAHGYFTFHAEKISVQWTVQAVERNAVVFSLEATHDDVNYYDRRAKRTPTRGLFRLTRKPRSRLWIPS
jgi:hypothetical protein